MRRLLDRDSRQCCDRCKHSLPNTPKMNLRLLCAHNAHNKIVGCATHSMVCHHRVIEVTIYSPSFASESSMETAKRYILELQLSSKSYLMLFLAYQQLRLPKRPLSSPTIVLITDRTDLDDQLSKTFLKCHQIYRRQGPIVQANSREALGELCVTTLVGGVFLTTIQKFEEGTGLLSDRANIICISDEAHRSQAGLGMKTKITEKGVTRSMASLANTCGIRYLMRHTSALPAHLLTTPLMCLAQL